MSFPTSPSEGQQYTDEYSTVWEWHFHRWYRVGISKDNPPNYGASLSTEASNGLPAGGTAGQILVKNSAADYVAEWQEPAASYTDFYLGSYAGTANYPASASQGQWIIDSGTDQIVVWDNDSQSWASTSISVTSTPTAPSVDYPYQYVYSDVDGTGYGYMGASPAGKWTNTPTGKLQAEGYTSDILSRRIKFATLQNPGDEVTFQATDNLTAFNRYAIIGLTKGTDADAMSWKVAGQPSSGTAWMLSDSADRDKVELYTAYIEPYWGGASYGHNLVGRSNSNGLSGLSGVQGEKAITFKVQDDYRIAMYVEGHFFVQTNIVPTGGVDFYLVTYGQTGRTFFQPTGLVVTPTANTDTSAPQAPTTGVRYFMSTVGSAGTELASGGGYYLYSAASPGLEGDVELDDSEAAAAAFCRVFIDYTDMTLTERAESTLPIVEQDERVLAEVQYLARGYFHSLDLDLTAIQAKMALYNDALAAATAGSVEATLGQLQVLTIPSAGTSAESFPYDPNSVFNASSFDQSYEYYYPGDPVREAYGISQIEFSNSFITIHFADSNAMTAWRSQDQIFEVKANGTYSFEKPLTLNAAAEYSSSYFNYVSYDLSNQLTQAEKDELADVAASMSGSPFNIEINNSGASPAEALGETAVVSELIQKLVLHLSKFPR